MELDAECSRLDVDFDQILVDMKPYVLRLPHKSERQRCAVWIKKFCDPPIGTAARRNRNAYAQLLSHMLKKGILEGPFVHKPDPGPLPALPSYMSVYYDDAKQLAGGDQNVLPDWVKGELNGDTTGLSSLAGTSSHLNLDIDRARDRIGRSNTNDVRVPPLNLGRSSYPGSEDESLHMDEPPPPPFRRDQTREMDFLRNDHSLGTTFNTTRASTLKDETTFLKTYDKEMEMKSKMFEAKLQEEKLRLQQKHDANVQKILDRKNSEIEELKNHYRTKNREQEETLSKYERKLQQVQKDFAGMKETKDRQIEELKRLTQESSDSRTSDIERRLHEAVSGFEREKFELQKVHTKNIQELLDDTNNRLKKMEDEYNLQMNATSALIRELEQRVQQLTSESENHTRIRIELEKQKTELEGRNERLQQDLIDVQSKHIVLDKDSGKLKMEHEHEIRSLKNKHEANIEFLKQEHNLQSIKAADTISDLELHVSRLKQSLDTADIEKQKALREAEEQYQQDRVHLEQCHEKKVRSLQNEIDNIQQELHKKIRKLEATVREKDEELAKVRRQVDEQSEKSQRALEDFKQQLSSNSTKLYVDMKQQMEKVESDLNRSKQAREKQSKEYQRQRDQDLKKYQQQVSELRVQYEEDKSRVLADFHTQHERLRAEKEREIAALKESLAQDLDDMETRARERQERDAKTISELESSVSELREEVVSANQLRKQQLVELGLLREEEKQRMAREHDAQLKRVRSEAEQARLDLEKKSSLDMEHMLEKTNDRLKDIEKDYTERIKKANETVSELQKALHGVQEDMVRREAEAEEAMRAATARAQDDRKKLKQQHANNAMNLQQDTDTYKNKVRQLERKVAALEHEHEEKLTALRTQYEEKMRGLIPSSVRQDLEEMIQALQTQVASLKHHNRVLQQLLHLHKQQATEDSTYQSYSASSVVSSVQEHKNNNDNITNSLTASSKSILGFLNDDPLNKDSIVKMIGNEFVPLEPEHDV